MKPVFTRSAAVSTVLLVVVFCGAEADAQTNPLFSQNFWALAPPDQGQWNDASNWNFFVPDGTIGEYASIFNGGTAVIGTAISASPTDIYLGHQDLTDEFNPGPFGPGALIIEDGGGITAMTNVLSEGNGQLRNGAGDVGTLTLHDAMGTVSLEGYLQSGTSTLNLEIGGTTFNPVTVSREIQLGGVLQVNGALASATTTSSWTIFDGSAGGATVSGQFQQIINNSSYVFGPGQSFAVSTANDSVTLGIRQQLFLHVDPYAGTAVLSNPAGSGVDVELTGYVMSVLNGTMDNSQWVSFTDDGVSGFDESFNATQVGETSATGMATVVSGSDKNLGSPLAIDINQPIGTNLLDSVSFQYSSPDHAIIDAVIVRAGNRQNNLVLVVDPNDGSAILQNQSNDIADLTGYVIESESGALLSTWDNLEGQGVLGWDVVAGTANALAELNPEESSLLGVGEMLDLGFLWNQSAEDLSLEFSLFGDEASRVGAVFYGDPMVAGFEADFNRDGKVDGDDFLAWQTGFGTQSGADKMDGDYDNDGDVDGDDFLGWQDEFGSGGGNGAAAVPEPASVILLLLALVGAVFPARRL